MIRFDPVSHTYWRGNERVISVTQALSVIENLNHIDPVILEAARKFGTHCHLMIDLFNRGILDESDLDPALDLRLQQYKRFLFESKFRVAVSEQRVFSAVLTYAGTLDIIGELPGWRFKMKTALVDLKSGAVPRTVGPQTAAYARAAPQDVTHRYALQLRENTYRLIPLTKDGDFTVFLSALNLIKFNNKGNPYESEDRNDQLPIAGSDRPTRRSQRSK